MKLSIKNPEDFWAGVMFIGFGVLAIVVARDYPYGSAMRMGPGYFPTWLGGIMIAIGAVIAFRSTRFAGTGIGLWAWRPLVVLSLAFLVYGLLMETFSAGFVPSLVAVIVLSSFAGREFRPLELLLLTAVLVAGAVGLFIYGLELPYPLFWER